MDMMIGAGITLFALVIGYVLGSRKDESFQVLLNEHYKDMTILTNQFANLTAQLYNVNRNTVNEPTVAFPPGEEYKEPLEEPQEYADVGGGRL